MSRAALLPEPRPDFLREARGSRHAVDLDLVYVGPLVHGGTCVQRMMALQELGCRVVSVDTRPDWLARRMQRLDHRAIERVLGPRDEARANAALLALPDAPAPAIVWVDKGLTIAPATLRALRARWPHAAFVSF